MAVPTVARACAFAASMASSATVDRLLVVAVGGGGEQEVGAVDEAEDHHPLLPLLEVVLVLERVDVGGAAGVRDLLPAAGWGDEGPAVPVAVRSRAVGIGVTVAARCAGVIGRVTGLGVATSGRYCEAGALLGGALRCHRRDAVGFLAVAAAAAGEPWGGHDAASRPSGHTPAFRPVIS
jgi:hypothetical protein